MYCTVPLKPLGAVVGRRPCRHHRRRHRLRQRRVERLRTGGGRPRGQSEVEQLDVRRARRSASTHQHHVARLQIAMDDACAVGAVERVADLDRQRQRLIDGKPGDRRNRSASVSPSRYSSTR